MTIVSLAIVLSFHLKSTPTQLELRMAQPLGIIFWVLSLLCLALGFGNYMKTVNKYSRRVAIVQSGWKTQGVSDAFSYLFLPMGLIMLGEIRFVNFGCDRGLSTNGEIPSTFAQGGRDFSG